MSEVIWYCNVDTVVRLSSLATERIVAYAKPVSYISAHRQSGRDRCKAQHV